MTSSEQDALTFYGHHRHCWLRLKSHDWWSRSSLIDKWVPTRAAHDRKVEALQARIAEARADQTRRIVEWLRDDAARRSVGVPGGEAAQNALRHAANAVEHEFGTQPEERAA